MGGRGSSCGPRPAPAQYPHWISLHSRVQVKRLESPRTGWSAQRETPGTSRQPQSSAGPRPALDCSAPSTRAVTDAHQADCCVLYLRQLPSLSFTQQTNVDSSPCHRINAKIGSVKADLRRIKAGFPNGSRHLRIAENSLAPGVGFTFASTSSAWCQLRAPSL